MTIETEVALLTTATTALTTEVQGQKTTLDANVAAAAADRVLAQTAATDAQTAETNAETAETNAETAQTAAELAEANAIAVVSGGTASITPTPGLIPLAAASGKIDMNWLTHVLPATTTTLAMTDGVAAGIYPAVQPGVPDAWRFNKAASWYNETRTTGRYLGEFANVTAAAGATGAAIADYYYNTTSKDYQELDNIGTPADTETLRAGSKEFPASIVVVTRSGNTRAFILDAKDGSMWMAFNESSNAFFRPNNEAIDYKNGLLVFGNNTAMGVVLVDFKSDDAVVKNVNASYPYVGRGVKDRNETSGSNVANPAHDALLSSNVVSVAIGDASKHYGFDEWGVPKQYIAAGTDSTNGISVIHPNGKVYDITGSANNVRDVTFNNYGELLSCALNREWLYVYAIPFRDISVSSYKRRQINLGNVSTSAETFPRVWLENAGADFIQTRSLDQKNITIEDDGKVITVVDEDIYGTSGNIGSDSPTSYIGYDSALTEQFVSPMVDRLVTAAIGMEVGTTSLVGSGDLVTNGADFTGASGTTPPTGWTTSTGAPEFSVSSGVLSFDRNGAAGTEADLTQTGLGLDSGDHYEVAVKIDGITDGSSITITLGADTAALTVSGAGVYKAQFFSDGTSTVSLRANQANAVLEVDYLRVYSITTDRSQLNINHAKINGTITRAKYGAGDVVMHSGASASTGVNDGAYWELGYDVFATDGVMFDGWVDFDSTLKYLLSNRPLDGSGNPIVTNTTAANNGSALWVATSNALTIRDDNGSTVAATGISTAPADGLHHVVVILSSTDIYVYIDGELDNVAASVTLTAPAAAITYVHPFDMALPRVGGIDRKATPDFYRWKYAKERRLFNSGAESTLQYTGNVVDVAVDEARKTYTVLQTDGFTTFDDDNIVAASGAVSDTAISISVHDGDAVILDGANLTTTVAAKDLVEHPVFKLKNTRVFEYDSLMAADQRIFGTAISQAPDGSGTTVGDTFVYSGSPAGTVANIASMADMFDDAAGSYLLSFTISDYVAGTMTYDVFGTAGTSRGANGTFTETLVYDPAAGSASTIRMGFTGSADFAISDLRIRKVGTPYWLPKGWQIVSVCEDGSKVRPDTNDLIRDGAIVRNAEGQEGWMSTADTWNTISIEAMEVV